MLLCIFFDFKKAFNNVNSEALWNILQKLGCPNLFFKLVFALYTGMNDIRSRGELFKVGNRVKQGCVLAPKLFSIFLSMLLSEVFTDSIQGEWIQSLPRKNLFNVSQFKCARKTRNVLVRELVFADNSAFVAHNHQDTREIIACFSKSAKAFGLKGNLKNTELIYQPSLWSYDIDQGILIEGQILTQVNKFKYLGSIFSNYKLNAELDTRTLNDSKALGGVRKWVWLNKDLSI